MPSNLIAYRAVRPQSPMRRGKTMGTKEYKDN